jgi:hypothetical protein
VSTCNFLQFLEKHSAGVIAHSSPNGRFSAGGDNVNKWRPAGTLVVLLMNLPASSQTLEFLPEINTHVELNHRVRLLFQAKQTRENGEPVQGEIGPSLDTYVGPKTDIKLLLLSFGYRVLPSARAPLTHRVLMIAKPRISLAWKLELTDRNRGELNASEGDLTWRYRNRLELARQIAISTYHPTPYANVEVFYDSKFHKWSSTAVEVGCRFPVRRHAEIEAYYEHQNNTGKAPNEQVDALGLMLNLEF